MDTDGKGNGELIAVCDKCFRACCLKGYFLCSDAKDAGVKFVEKSRLLEWNLEDKGWMSNNNSKQ